MKLKLKKKQQTWDGLFSDALEGKWIPFSHPGLVQLNVKSTEDIDASLIESKVAKIIVSLDEGEEIDIEALETFLRLHTLAFQLTITRTKSRRTRIREKLSSKSPEEAIRSYMTQFPPLNPEATLTAALTCLDAD